MRIAVLRLRRAIATDEAGFTIIEMMVAVGIILVALLTMAYVATVTFTDVAEARQRQGATGVANQTMEQLRALPFSSITTGMSKSELSATTDSRIQKNCGGVSGVYCYQNETIPAGDGVPTSVPLNPHQFTTTVGITTYTSFVYLTYLNNATTSKVYRATVIVTWATAARHGVSSQVQVQTTITSPKGCLSVTTHPFQAPCQPFFFISSLRSQGSIATTPATAPSGGISGIASVPAFDDATLWTTGHSADMQVEQISLVQGTSRTSGADLKLTGANEQDIGRQSVSSVSENDPSQPGQDYQSVSTAAQSSSTLSDSGGGNSITVTSSGGDTGTTRSTTSASISPAHNCPNVAGTNETDSLPCGSSDALQGGTMSTAVAFTASGQNLGTATIVSVAAPTTKGVSFVNRDNPSGGDGLVHMDGTRYVGTLQLGAIPSGFASTPAGWAGYYIQLTGFHDSVSSEAGLSAAAPTVTSTGTLKVWNGSGYNTITLAPGAATTITVTSLNYTAPGQSQTVIMSATLSTGGTATTAAENCGSPCTRTSATATSNSPLIGDINYQVWKANSNLCTLDIHFDLGSLTTKATYTPSPSS